MDAIVVRNHSYLRNFITRPSGVCTEDLGMRLENDLLIMTSDFCVVIESKQGVVIVWQIVHQQEWKKEWRDRVAPNVVFGYYVMLLLSCVCSISHHWMCKIPAIYIQEVLQPAEI